ncbi:hypothetical protein [Trichlorobacter ammonificans]|uniref:Uncharacterized protein n=1 Tax=Trichlorobacter ammonificans TaxID=2916410 RepID=A0ABM9D9L5_9BACT|nr:hypothetical protein [Trichlorobacter ammonificans]CAH2031914.1 conserved membrane protein of unknown function [Trichlorobacter ammonificans]
MEKEQVLEKTVEALRPFETQNLMTTIQNLTLQQIFSNWVILLSLAALLFFGIYKRSKTVLLTVFSLVALTIMVKVAIPPEGQEMSLKSVLPFVGFGLGIGGVIVYFTFIKD